MATPSERAGIAPRVKRLGSARLGRADSLPTHAEHGAGIPDELLL
jgi:hypothetical protein